MQSMLRNLSIFSVIAILTFFFYQNCSPSQFSKQAAVTNPGSEGPTECANGALCFPFHTVRAVNGILAKLGDFKMDAGSSVDANGFYHVSLINNISGRKSFIKIKYVSGVLQAEIDETKTSYKWVCLDHSQPATAMINVAGVATPNCWSPIRVFDETTVVDIGASGNTPIDPAYLPAESFRVEIPTVNDVMAKNATTFHGCRCKFTASWVATMIGPSQGIFTSITTNDQLRITATAAQCNGLTTNVNYSSYFSSCVVGSVP